MTNVTGERNIFRTVPTKPLAKSDITNDAARAIIRVEAERQHAKTTRLREARLAFEALLTPAFPQAGARVRKTDSKTRTIKTLEQHQGTP